MAKRPLGDLLVEAGLVSPQDLQRALQESERLGERLGRTITRLGLATETDVAQALAAQLGLPFVDERHLSVDVSVAQRFGEAAARQHGALPVALEGGAVTVAMSDPLNVVALDDIAFLFRAEPRPVVVTPSTIDRLIARVFMQGGREGRTDAPAQAGASREAPANASTAVRWVDRILQEAVADGASDVHIETLGDRLRVRLRLDGVLHEKGTLPADLHPQVVSRLKILAGLDISERRLPQDGRIRMRVLGREVDMRVATMPTIHGEKVEIRILDRERGLVALDRLGFQDEALAAYRRLIARPHGLILVTGPTGSGKTTTLMASLMELNTPDRNLVTIEDPVEYELPGVNQVQVNVRAGLTFASALRAFLRQDPNVIMVGEIRDGETAEIAVRAALTGHLVLSTLHTNDAPSTPTRLQDMGVEPYLVAAALTGVVAQRLVRRLCERCREPYELPASAPERRALGIPDGSFVAYRPRRCSHCAGTGYRGRAPLFEVLPFDEELSSLVGRAATTAVLREAARRKGMITLREDGVRKAALGWTSLEEVARATFADG
ncbi:MAG: Flp pilus assembly complex ATPase component TadA [Clostridia bacterium]|nr:Flp pilus assembly complex ATPase component TadA [Clostridia bacterium]